MEQKPRSCSDCIHYKIEGPFCKLPRGICVHLIDKNRNELIKQKGVRSNEESCRNNKLVDGKKARVLITFEDGEKVLFYKGYTGSVKVDEDGWHYGKLFNYKGERIKDLVMYEGEILKALEKDFKKAVREYMHIIKRKERKQK